MRETVSLERCLCGWAQVYKGRIYLGGWFSHADPALSALTFFKADESIAAQVNPPRPAPPRPLFPIAVVSSTRRSFERTYLYRAAEVRRTLRSNCWQNRCHLRRMLSMLLIVLPVPHAAMSRRCSLLVRS